MADDTKPFHEIKGLFAAAHEKPELLEEAPDIVMYRFYENEMAIPVIIGFCRADETDFESEDNLIPLVAQRLTRDESGEWCWEATNPSFMLSTLNYGDPTDMAKFKENVRLFLERRSGAVMGPPPPPDIDDNQ